MKKILLLALSTSLVILDLFCISLNSIYAGGSIWAVHGNTKYAKSIDGGLLKKTTQKRYSGEVFTIFSEANAGKKLVLTADYDLQVTTWCQCYKTSCGNACAKTVQIYLDKNTNTSSPEKYCNGSTTSSILSYLNSADSTKNMYREKKVTRYNDAMFLDFVKESLKNGVPVITLICMKETAYFNWGGEDYAHYVVISGLYHKLDEKGNTVYWVKVNDPFSYYMSDNKKGTSYCLGEYGTIYIPLSTLNRSRRHNYYEDDAVICYNNKDNKTITYDLQYDHIMVQKYVDTGTSLIDDINKNNWIVPIRENCVFLGWYIDKKCSIKYDENTSINQNITLYAKWKNMATYACIKQDKNANKYYFND